MAVLEGEGPRADETIVIGAHYDHLGEERNDEGEPVVYNGANDNASGTAALLEIARILSNRKEKLPRRIVFVAFSGEELGLLGSLHYVDDPPVPLAQTIAMINLDMVGRLQSDTIVAMGTGSSPAMALAAERIAREHGISLLPISFSLPCSDHSPFHAHAVPVIFFATIGGLRDYHRPSDTAEKLNYEGIRRVARMTAGSFPYRKDVTWMRRSPGSGARRCASAAGTTAKSARMRAVFTESTIRPPGRESKSASLTRGPVSGVGSRHATPAAG